MQRINSKFREGVGFENVWICAICLSLKMKWCKYKRLWYIKYQVLCLSFMWKSVFGLSFNPRVWPWLVHCWIVVKQIDWQINKEMHKPVSNCMHEQINPETTTHCKQQLWKETVQLQLLKVCNITKHECSHKAYLLHCS